MTKGGTFPAEDTTFNDEQTGAQIRQVTSHPSIHHQPFFFIPAYDAAMRRLVFISHRTGAAQIFAEDRESGQLIQLTDRPDLHEWSVYPARNGRYLLFTAGGGAWRLDLETLREDELTHFDDAPGLDEGMVGASMGTTALSWDDRWWAVPVKWADGFRFFVINTENGDADIILEDEKIGHPQFCPDDSNMILYIAGMVERVWVTSRDGKDNRRIYARDTVKNEWITHESWLPGRREIAFVDWPHRVRAIHVDTGRERIIAEFNAWHAMPNWDGTMMVTDTNFPDIGIQLFDPREQNTSWRALCHPGASSIGEHWAGPFPYANGPVKVYAPQHTHPHPSFAPDNSRIVYTSDRDGHAQVYEAMIPQ